MEILAHGDAEKGAEGDAPTTTTRWTAVSGERGRGWRTGNGEGVSRAMRVGVFTDAK